MKQFLMAIVLVSVLFAGTLDQSYFQKVSLNGSSVLTQQLSTDLFIAQIQKDGLTRLQQNCRAGFTVPCLVDLENKLISFNESLEKRNDYYSYSVEYGFPDITYTLTINKIPTDRFSSDLDRLFTAANVTREEQIGSAQAVDLSANNSEMAYFIRRFNASVTYQIEMPATIVEAKAGETSGETSGLVVTFNLADVLDESNPVIVTSREPNWAYLAALAAVLVLAAFTVSFYLDQSKPSRIVTKEAAKKKKAKTKEPSDL